MARNGLSGRSKASLRRPSSPTSSSSEERAALDPLRDHYGFRILDKENGGQGSARNAGIASSKSEYISLLDQDDFYLLTHIEDLIETIPENDYRLGYVYADLCEADGDGNIVDSNILRGLPAPHPKQGHISGLLRGDMFVLPSASLIKRQAFEQVGGFDEQFTGYEDDDLFLRMFRAGFTNYFLDKPVTVWCIHTGSTSRSIRMSRSRFRYFQKMVEEFPDNDDRAMFYFRLCLMPRFEPCFIADIIKNKTLNKAERQEVNNILRNYSQIVRGHNNVSLLSKNRVRAITFLLTTFPDPVARIFWSFYRLPVLRTIARRILVRRPAVA
jgi:GT2 family glycosyltransferase